MVHQEMASSLHTCEYFQLIHHLQILKWEFSFDIVNSQFIHWFAAQGADTVVDCSVAEKDTTTTDETINSSIKFQGNSVEFYEYFGDWGDSITFDFIKREVDINFCGYLSSFSWHLRSWSSRSDMNFSRGYLLLEFGGWASDTSYQISSIRAAPEMLIFIFLTFQGHSNIIISNFCIPKLKLEV